MERACVSLSSESTPFHTQTWTLPTSAGQPGAALLMAVCVEGSGGRAGSGRLFKEMLMLCFAAKGFFPKAFSFFQIKEVFVWF